MTLWACALAKTTPRAASESRNGVLTLVLPEKPTASARRVSMVIRMTSRAMGLCAASGWREHAAKIRRAIVAIALRRLERSGIRGVVVNSWQIASAIDPLPGGGAPEARAVLDWQGNAAAPGTPSTVHR